MARCHACVHVWYAAVEQLLLCLPIEAAVERVLSLVKAYFGGNRYRLMSDYIEASLHIIPNDPNKI